MSIEKPSLSETSSVRSGMAVSATKIVGRALSPEYAAPDGAWGVFRMSYAINMALLTELARGLVPMKRPSQRRKQAKLFTKLHLATLREAIRLSKVGFVGPREAIRLNWNCLVEWGLAIGRAERPMQYEK